MDRKHIYQDLVGIVRYSMDAKIDQSRIESSIDLIISIFKDHPYDELLMCFYNRTSDNYIYGHIANNVLLAVAFGSFLELSSTDIKDIAFCAFGHDFGMKDYLEFFQKANALTESETKNIKQHTKISVDIFTPYFSKKILEGMQDIHECFNGQGYPQGKSGVDISDLAKVVSLCDVFEALTHPRAFRGEFSPYAALKMVISKKDIIFDKKYVKKFVEFLSIYPVGSLVHLNTGEIGVVIASNSGFPTRPVIRVLVNTENKVLDDGRMCNLIEDQLVNIDYPLDPEQEKELRTAFDLNAKG